MCSSEVFLKLEESSESFDKLDKTQIAGPHF